jgi:WD40 repeat protein
VGALLITVTVVSLTAARRIAAEARRAAEGELNARRNLYAADMNLAHQAGEAGDWGSARNLLMRHRPQAGQPDLRGFEWRYVWAKARGDNFATFRGHSNLVASVAVSPDGKTVLSGAQDRTVRMWDLASGQCVGVLPPFGGLVYSVAFSPDGKLFGVGGSNGASLWRTETRQQVSHLGGKMSRIAFSPVGTLVAFGTSATWDPKDGQSVFLVDYSTGNQVTNFPNGGSHATFSRDGKLLAMAGTNDGVRIWDIGSRREVGVLRKPDTVYGLAFSRDGQSLVAGYSAGDMCVWDVAGQHIRTSLTGHTLLVWQVAFSPDGQTMASASVDQTVRLWDVTTWRTKQVLRLHGQAICTVAFTPDGRTLVTGGKDGNLMLSSVEQTRPAESIEGIHSVPRISADGSSLAALGETGKVSLWDLPGRRLATELPSQAMPLGFLPGGRRLVTLEKGGRLTVWDTTTRTVQSERELRCEDPITWAVLSPDGQTVAAGNQRGVASLWNQRVRFWNTRDGEARGIVDGQTSMDNGLVFSPDNRRFVSVHDRTAEIWDLGPFKRLAELRKHRAYVSTCAWSPDGKLLATGSADGTTILWDTLTGTDLATLPGERAEDVAGVAFSPDGRTLATAGGGVLKFWNLATQRAVATLSHLDNPVELFFAPDDRELLVRCRGGTLRLLHAPSWEEIEAWEAKQSLRSWPK